MDGDIQQGQDPTRGRQLELPMEQSEEMAEIMNRAFAAGAGPFPAEFLHVAVPPWRTAASLPQGPGMAAPPGHSYAGHQEDFVHPGEDFHLYPDPPSAHSHPLAHDHVQLYLTESGGAGLPIPFMPEECEGLDMSIGQGGIRQAAGSSNACPETISRKRARAATQSRADLQLPKKGRKSQSAVPTESVHSGSDKENARVMVNNGDSVTFGDSRLDPDEDDGLGNHDVAEDSDVECDEGEADEGERKRKWTSDDRTLLYKYLLEGADADERFDKLQKNKTLVFRKAIGVLKFDGCYTPAAASKHYERALKTYRAIKVALSVTGGAGDVDLHDHAGALKHYNAKLKKARQGGKNVGKLTAKMIEIWQNMGWYRLFDGRYSADTRMARAVVRHSASALSDHEDVPAVVDSPRSSPPKASTPQQIVSEPKHRGKVKPEMPTHIGALHDTLKKKLESDEARALERQAAVKERLQIERDRLRLEKEREDNRIRLEVVRAAGSSDVLSSETKDKINSWVGSLFS